MYKTLLCVCIRKLTIGRMGVSIPCHALKKPLHLPVVVGGCSDSLPGVLIPVQSYICDAGVKDAQYNITSPGWIEAREAVRYVLVLGVYFCDIHAARAVRYVLVLGVYLCDSCLFVSKQTCGLPVKV